MNRKGVYSLASSFMYIVIVVSIILVLVYTNYLTAAQQSDFLDGIQPFYDSVDAKDKIIYCLNPITEKEIENEIATENCLSQIPLLNGYEFRQLNFFDCDEMVWRIGETELCNKKLSFLLTKEDSELNCLTMLSLCFKGRATERKPYPVGVGCEDGTCDAGDVCFNPTVIDTCDEPVACMKKTCTDGCNNPASPIPGGEKDTFGEFLCDDTTGCATLPCECNGNGLCMPVGAEPLCGDGTCELNEDCPGDAISCLDPDVCFEKSCIEGCNNPPDPIPNGGQDDSGANLCNIDTGCATPPCECDGDGHCNNQIGPVTCPNGVCAPGENCPADVTDCTEPNACYEKTCTAGCNNPANPVPNATQDIIGANLCDDTTGCLFTPCHCDGTGKCVHIPNCGNNFCEISEDCPEDASDCEEPTKCLEKSCVNGCNNPATPVPNGQMDATGLNRCTLFVGCIAPPCHCDGAGTCISVPTCGNGTCEAGEDCPPDAGSCPEPNVCFEKTCVNSCNNPADPVANGNQDDLGANLCNDLTGCTVPPCQCDGVGTCENQGSGPACNDGTCDVAENCPGDATACGDPLVCYARTCVNGCNNPANLVPSGQQDTSGANQCTAVLGCTNPPCECDGVGTCVDQIVGPVCNDGTCEVGENCAADVTSCAEPSVCLVTTCTNGCNNPASAMAVGRQDTSGANQCNDITGCVSPPCECDGAGTCVDQIVGPVCNDGTCEVGENCAADVGSCEEPLACKETTCTNGCNNPSTNIASGQQDTMGVNLCNDTTGCANTPCSCDGSGSCIDQPDLCAGNLPPVANAGPDTTVNTGQPFAFDGSGSFDPEGGSLDYWWNFDDGTQTFNWTGTEFQIKIYVATGTYYVTLKVRDDCGNESNLDGVNVSVIW